MCQQLVNKLVEGYREQYKIELPRNTKIKLPRNIDTNWRDLPFNTVSSSLGVYHKFDTLKFAVDCPADPRHAVGIIYDLLAPPSYGLLTLSSHIGLPISRSLLDSWLI
jgi:hypothetical protein